MLLLLLLLFLLLLLLVLLFFFVGPTDAFKHKDTVTSDWKAEHAFILN